MSLGRVPQGRELATQDVLKKNAGLISLGLAGGVAALLAHGLVDNTLFFPDMALVFALTLALAQ